MMKMVMISYLQDTTPLLNDWSAISTASGVYKKITKMKTFWQVLVDQMIQRGTSLNCLLGCIFSLYHVSQSPFFFKF